MIRAILMLSLLGHAAQAEIIVASRVIPANAIISSEDIQYRDISYAGGVTNPNELLGMEARHALFAGRPILSKDVTTPAVVERNEIVQLLFQSGGVLIKTEGRALDRAGSGEIIRVMNLASRKTISARIDSLGVAHVLQ